MAWKKKTGSIDLKEVQIRTLNADTNTSSHWDNLFNTIIETAYFVLYTNLMSCKYRIIRNDILRNYFLLWIVLGTALGGLFAFFFYL
jgi:hypothetical protein